MKTADLRSALRENYASEVSQATGANGLLSRREERALSSEDIAIAVDDLAQKNVPRPFKSVDIVDAAMARADSENLRTNQARGPGRAFVSRDEIGRWMERSPALGGRALYLWNILRGGVEPDAILAKTRLVQAVSNYVGPWTAPDLSVDSVAHTDGPFGQGLNVTFSFPKVSGDIVRGALVLRGPTLDELKNIAVSSPSPAPSVSALEANVKTALGSTVTVLGVATAPDMLIAVVEDHATTDAAGDHVAATSGTSPSGTTAAGTTSAGGGATAAGTASGAGRAGLRPSPYLIVGTPGSRADEITGLGRLIPEERHRSLLEALALRLAVNRILEVAASYDQTMAELRQAGESVPPPPGPVATLEAHLRTARLATSDLVEQTEEESAVGFNPGTELFQWMAPSLLGDIAVFVTFDRTGHARIEDFN